MIALCVGDNGGGAGGSESAGGQAPGGFGAVEGAAAISTAGAISNFELANGPRLDPPLPPPRAALNSESNGLGAMSPKRGGASGERSGAMAGEGLAIAGPPAQAWHAASAAATAPAARSSGKLSLSLRPNALMVRSAKPGAPRAGA